MREAFGTMPDGGAVERLTIAGGGLQARILNWGAVLQDLRLDGHDAPLVLGFPRFEPYPEISPHFGAVAGRCANRVRGGPLELDGRGFELDRNFLGRHCLHGGALGTGKLPWRIEEHGDDRAVLGISLPDGHMGFPGKFEARVAYAAAPGGTLDIRMQASANAATLCSLAHHSYFNLDGAETIDEHLLSVEAPSYLPVDDELIPTGEIRPVAQTRFDFRSPARVAQARPVDHNYCLSRERVPIRPVARLTSPASGVTMECRTTEPGLQVYDGAKIDIDEPGLAGRAMRAHAGIALEPQGWPDAIHHAAFPQSVLRPGEIYRQHTQYVFRRE